MKTWKVLVSLAVVACYCQVSGVHGADEPPKAAEPGTLIVIDNAGKEHKLKSWKITAGTRRLAWLAPVAKADQEKPKEEKEKPKEEKEKPKEEKDTPAGEVGVPESSGGAFWRAGSAADRAKPADDDAPKPPAGREVLVFREENSTNFVEGILTFVPLEAVRALDYDNEKQTVTVRVAVSDKAEEDKQLTGTTKFQGDNKLAIESEIDKGELGVAEVKFLGGVPKGIRGVRFPPPKQLPNAAQAGPPVSISSTDKKDKTPHELVELKALYRTADGNERLLTTLMFKKTLKLELGKMKKLRIADANKEGAECTVTLKEDEEHTLTLLRSMPIDDKPAELEGFVGRSAAGYKLFPVHTIAEVKFSEGK